MRFLRALTGLIALSFLAACNGPASDNASSSNGVSLAGHHDAAELAANAASGIYMNATMATLGSFEWDVAPITNHEADLLLSIPLDLKSKAITKVEAQKKLDTVEKAHDLSQKALKTCAQDSKTGKCKGNEVKARALLDQAKAQLAGL